MANNQIFDDQLAKDKSKDIGRFKSHCLYLSPTVLSNKSSTLGC